MNRLYSLFPLSCALLVASGLSLTEAAAAAGGTGGTTASSPVGTATSKPDASPKVNDPKDPKVKDPKDPKAPSEPNSTPLSLDALLAGTFEMDLPTLEDTKPADLLPCQVTGEITPNNRLRLQLDKLSNVSCHPLLTVLPASQKVDVVVGDKHAQVTLNPSVNAVDPFHLNSNGKQITGTKVGTTVHPLDAGAELFWVNGSSWQTIRAEGNTLTLTDDVPTKVLVNFDSLGHVTPGAARLAEIDKPDCEQPTPPPRDWCKRALTGTTVCLDFYDNALGRSQRRVDVFPNDTNQVLPPNTSVRVVVLRKRTASTAMQLAGEEGVFVSKDQDQTGGGGLKTQADHAASDCPPVVQDYDIDDQVFAPRLPGNANLTVTVTDGGKDEVRTVEFVVETTYIGAVRVGAAMVFNATDRAYEARAIAGSKQTEIAVTKKSTQDIELVVGYSAYLSPRGYANTSWTNFEPYVGIGVLNQGPTALETLKSLHFGLEWEASANFGVAFTGVVRRVQRLADGYSIQSPISGAVPTVEKAEVGFGIVFNLSPDFLRIAKQSGSTFFK